MGFLGDINSQLHRISLRTKVILVLFVILGVFIFRVSFSTRYYMVNRHGQEMVSDGLKVAHRYLDNHIRQFDLNLRGLADEVQDNGTSSDNLRHLYQLTRTWDKQYRPDMFFYIDNGGQVRYSSNNTYSDAEKVSVGRRFMSLQAVQKAMAGQMASGIEIIPRELLKFERLLDMSRISIVPTPNADSPGYSLEDKGMAVISAFPVYENGKIVGVLTAAQILNNKFEIVDLIAKDINIKSTIFMDSVGISTTVLDENGERAVGTIISKPVQEQVLKAGKDYFGRAFVVRDWYVTAYEPIRDLHNGVIGALYVGMEETPLVETQKALNNDIRLTMLIVTLIFLAALYWLYRSIVLPIREMSSTALCFARGELKARIPIQNLNRCWEIRNCELFECPVYGKRNLRCWLVPQTNCCNTDDAPARKGVCVHCKVYKSLVGNEIDQLADSLNFMAASIQEHTDSLNDLNIELEEKNCKLLDWKDELECQKEQLMALNNDLEESMKALDDSQSIIYALAVAVEAKDPYTRGHSERVADYSVKLAASIGLPSNQFDNIRGAALLHDIGKIGISGSILRKPGTLTAMEFQQVKKHPIIGERICSSLKFAQAMLPIIRHHHEHYNGKGYPDGLKGEKIPLSARVVAVADAFDAMTSDRPYRSGMSPEEALAILEIGAGSQWDSKLVSEFVGLMRMEQDKTQRLQRRKSDEPRI